MAETEQNKTEDPTPFKLKQARKKGMVAKSVELGFFSVLAAATLMVVFSGPRLGAQLTWALQLIFQIGVSTEQRPLETLTLAAKAFAPAMVAVATLGAMACACVAALEIVQLRGVTLSTDPLRPDFSRLNPAKGLKRVFSLRTIRETGKAVAKLAAYSIGAILIGKQSIVTLARAADDAPALVQAIYASGVRLLLVFTAMALAFSLLDQILARQEFRKQMRMSKSELKREWREREGEPQIKQKRRQLHKQFTQQTRALGDLGGADVLIVNPHHYAVGLAYDPSKVLAPLVVAKGRNRFALLLRHRAQMLSLPIVENPPLARLLYSTSATGQCISAEAFRGVAEVYLKLRLM